MKQKRLNEIQLSVRSSIGLTLSEWTVQYCSLPFLGTVTILHVAACVFSSTIQVP